MEIISVIIPAYNAESTIIRCVGSILRQSYQDFCIYIVDDCSTDGTWDILQKLSLLDSRIRVSRLSINQGPSVARNTALNKAKGEWICFIDADDTISSNFLSDLFKEAQRSHKDMVLCSVRQVAENGTLLRELVASDNYITSSPEETLQKAYGEKEDLEFLLNLCVSKLLRRKLFDNCKFPEHRLQEDAFITPYLIYNSGKGLAVAPGAYYFYYDNHSSISHKAQSNFLDFKRRQDLLYLYENHIKLYILKNNKLYLRSRANYINNVISIYKIHYPALHYLCKSDFQKIHKEFKKYYILSIKEYNPYLSWKLLMSLILFLWSPSLYLNIFNKE